MASEGSVFRQMWSLGALHRLSEPACIHSLLEWPIRSLRMRRAWKRKASGASQNQPLLRSCPSAGWSTRFRTQLFKVGTKAHAWTTSWAITTLWLWLLQFARLSRSEPIFTAASLPSMKTLAFSEAQWLVKRSKRSWQRPTLTWTRPKEPRSWINSRAHKASDAHRLLIHRFEKLIWRLLKRMRGPWSSCLNWIIKQRSHRRRKKRKN